MASISINKLSEEEIIKQLKEKVVSIEYSEKPTRKEKISKKDLWEKAKLVRRHLSDDSLPAANPARP